MGERASEKERERGRDFCLFEPRSISVRRGLFESISRRRKRREREKGGGRENTNDRMEMEEKRFGTGLDGGKNGNRRDGADRTVDDDRIGTQDGRGEEGSVARVVDGKNRKGTRS